MSVIVLELCGHKHTTPPLWWEQTDICVWATDKAETGIPGRRSWAVVAAVVYTCDAESWGAHLRLFTQPCGGPAQNCSHSKQANPKRLIETKPEILAGVETSTRPQGKAVRISCFLCVLLTGCPGFLQNFSQENQVLDMLRNTSCKTKAEFWLRHLSRLSGLLWDLYTSVLVLE